MKILVNFNEIGWKNDYKAILEYFSEFPHIKLEEINDNGHWKGLLLCSTDFCAGLRPACYTINDNTNNSTTLSQYVLESVE